MNAITLCRMSFAFDVCIYDLCVAKKYARTDIHACIGFVLALLAVCCWCRRCRCRWRLSLSFSSRLSVLFTYFSLFTQRDFVAAMRITASVSTRFIQNGYVKNASVYAWTFCTNYTQVVCKGHLPNYEPQSLWTITFE